MPSVRRGQDIIFYRTRKIGVGWLLNVAAQASRENAPLIRHCAVSETVEE
jgi:hypothetical protein